MKQFEYKIITDINGFITHKRTMGERYKESEIDIHEEILNELGADGWDMIPMGNGYFAKREVKYAKTKKAESVLK